MSSYIDKERYKSTYAELYNIAADRADIDTTSGGLKSEADADKLEILQRVQTTLWLTCGVPMEDFNALEELVMNDVQAMRQQLRDITPGFFGP